MGSSSVDHHMGVGAERDHLLVIAESFIATKSFERSSESECHGSHPIGRVGSFGQELAAASIRSRAQETPTGRP